MELAPLGVGIVYVPGLESVFESGDSLVDVIEIEPQTFWNHKGEQQECNSIPNSTLKIIESLPQRKIIHSVGCGVGGLSQPDSEFCKSISTLAQQLDSPWISEHLSITQIQTPKETCHTGFMLPPLQTQDGAISAAKTIRNFKQKLPVPVAIENSVNYIRPQEWEISDGEFFSLVVDLADCGILLDLHNLWANEKNGRQSVDEFLRQIPLDKVWEIHVAGGFEHEGYWLDSHSGPIPERVISLAHELVPSLINLKTIVYEIFPSYVPLFGISNIVNEIEKLNILWQDRRQKSPNEQFRRIPSHISKPKQQHVDSKLTPFSWEQALGELLEHSKSTVTLAKELESDPGISLIKKMIWKFRAGSILKSLSVICKLIINSSGIDFLESTLDNYFRESKPKPYASQEATLFLEYLKEASLDVPYLMETILLEETSISAQLAEKNLSVFLPVNPLELLADIQEGNTPKELSEGEYLLEVPCDQMLLS